jgi:hypothetical protein
MLAAIDSPVRGSIESTMMPQGEGDCGSGITLTWW